MGLEDMIQNVKSKEKFLFMSDTHMGFQDKKAIDLVINVAKDQRPDNIIFGGDMIDAYIASKFGKDFCRMTIQDEVDEFIDQIYKPLLKVCPKSKYTYIEGNHEARLASRAMEDHAFQGIRLLTYGNILNSSCRDKGLPVMAYDTELLIQYRGKPIFLFKHGNKANKYSANAELELENISGMSGHVHKTDIRYKTTRAGTISWRNVGHLSDVTKQKYTQKYSNKSPNWNLGFGFLVTDKARIYPMAVDINPDYTCMLGGKLYAR